MGARLGFPAGTFDFSIVTVSSKSQWHGFLMDFCCLLTWMHVHVRNCRNSMAWTWNDFVLSPALVRWIPDPQDNHQSEVGGQSQQKGANPPQTGTNLRWRVRLQRRPCIQNTAKGCQLIQLNSLGTASEGQLTIPSNK